MKRKFRMVCVKVTVQVVSDTGLAFSEVCRLVETKLRTINEEAGQDIWIRKIHSMEMGPLRDTPESYEDDKAAAKTDAEDNG